MVMVMVVEEQLIIMILRSNHWFDNRQSTTLSTRLRCVFCTSAYDVSRVTTTRNTENYVDRTILNSTPVYFWCTTQHHVRKVYDSVIGYFFGGRRYHYLAGELRISEYQQEKRQVDNNWFSQWRLSVVSFKFCKKVFWRETVRGLDSQTYTWPALISRKGIWNKVCVDNMSSAMPFQRWIELFLV